MNLPIATGFLGLAAFAAAAFAQINTSTMDGTVTDPQSATVAKADVTIVNSLTGQRFHTLSDDKGHWAVPALPTATYSVPCSRVVDPDATHDNCPPC